MAFIIGRGCAELQILKKNENGRTEWNIVMIFCIHNWYWQYVAQEIVKCHFGRGIAEVQILKNSETGPISWNFWIFDKIMHKYCYWRELDRGLPNVIYHQ